MLTWAQWGSKSVIGNLISGFSAFNAEYVHGGLSVGQECLVEVNGGIPGDNINGVRLMANIYLTDIRRDTAGTSYDVWRCNDRELASDIQRNATTRTPAARSGTSPQSGEFPILVSRAVNWSPLHEAKGDPLLPSRTASWKDCAHRLERTLIHRPVEQHFTAFADQAIAQGTPLSKYVQREFEDYLNCGRLEGGFLRVRCHTCRAEQLMAFS